MLSPNDINNSLRFKRYKAQSPGAPPCALENVSSQAYGFHGGRAWYSGCAFEPEIFSKSCLRIVDGFCASACAFACRHASCQEGWRLLYCSNECSSRNLRAPRETSMNEPSVRLTWRIGMSVSVRL